MGTAWLRLAAGRDFDACLQPMKGGFNAFEMLPPDDDSEWQPGPEEKWLVDAKIEADNDNNAAEKCLASFSMHDLDPYPSPVLRERQALSKHMICADVAAACWLPIYLFVAMP